MSDLFTQMAERWASPSVARSKVGIFTGGAITPKSMANLDSLGEGCPERVTINGHICYPVDSFVSWLRDRSAVPTKKRGQL